MFGHIVLALNLACLIALTFVFFRLTRRVMEAHQSPIIVDPSLAPKLADITAKIERIGQFEASPIIITDTKAVKDITIALHNLADAYKALSEKKLEVRQTVQTPDGFDLREIQAVLKSLSVDIPDLRARFDEYENLMRQIRGR
jgi:hypothetical protein